MDEGTLSLAARLRTTITIEHGLGDMWPVFGDAELLADVVDALAEPFRQVGVTKVAGVEARGFVLGGAVAAALGAGFVGIRKPGGWYPGPTHQCRSPADYRGNEFVLRLQRAALGPDDRVVLVDDWFETGGQAITAISLIEASGAKYVGASIVVDWLSPEMRERLAPVHGLVDIETLPAGPAGS